MSEKPLRNRSAALTIRLEPALRERMDSVRLKHRYRPSQTAVMERGIVLALAELEAEIATYGEKS